MAQRVALPLALIIALAACSEPRPATQVVVIFDGDPIVRRVTREIEIVVRGGDAGSTATPSENEQILRFDLESIGGWPVTHTIIPEGNDPSRLYLIEGRVYSALDREAPIGTARAISGYIEGRTLILRINFYGNCLYQEPCEDPEESCGPDGECINARFPASSLPSYVPGTDGGVPDAPTCVTDIDCDDLVSCTVDMCESGSCVRIPDETLCAPGPEVRCDPLNGCQYGTGCEPATCASTGCESAQCVGDVCMRTPLCLPGQTCCEGVCNGCLSDDCHSASCDVATDMCVRAPQTDAPCDDSVYCNGADTCSSDGVCDQHTGDPCGGAMCVEADRTCASCTSDAQCPPAPIGSGSWGPCIPIDSAPCQIAGTESRPIETRSCMSGTCVPSGMSTETRPCTVSGVEGNICDMTPPVCSGPCAPRSGTCTADGVQMGTTTTTRCRSGACTDVTSATVDCDCVPSNWPSCQDAVVSDGGPRDGGRMDSCVAAIEICTGGIDEDCDGLVDCADPSCATASGCRDAGMDAGCFPVPETTGRCNNGIDDDCDGLTDCADVPQCCGNAACSGLPQCRDGGARTDSGIQDSGGPSLIDGPATIGDGSISRN